MSMTRRNACRTAWRYRSNENYVNACVRACSRTDHIARALLRALGCFGIPETELIRAEMLDVEGCDAEKLVEQTIKEMGLVGKRVAFPELI